jgi:FlaA1/EpsC-like NDP-sugar epimerase
MIFQEDKLKKFARGFFPAIQRTAFYGIAALLVSFIAYDANFLTIVKSSTIQTSFSDYFYAYMFWSVIAFPIITIVYIIFRKYFGLYSDIFHYDKYSFLALAVRDVVSIIITPFTFIGMIFDAVVKKDDVFMFSDVLDLVILVANVIYIFVAFMVVF